METPTFDTLLLPQESKLEDGYLLFGRLLGVQDTRGYIDLRQSLWVYEKWQEAFAWLAERRYIKIDRRQDKSLKGIFVARRTWTDAVPPPRLPQVKRIGYAFIDLPNIITKGDRWGVQLDGMLKNLKWDGFAQFIRESIGDVSSLVMYMYINGDTIRRNNGVMLYERFVTAAIDAGFVVVANQNSLKDVDAQIIVDMMDVDFTVIPKEGAVRYLLVSGDSDFLPALLRKQQHAARRSIDFDVTIVSWSQSVSIRLLRESGAQFIALNTRIDLFQP